MRNGTSIYVVFLLSASIFACVACSVRGSHNAEQSMVDSCAFELGILSDTLTHEMTDIHDINALLQTLEDSAVVRNDSMLLEWMSSVQGLAEEREELVHRADSLSRWCKRFFELLGKWQQAMQREATHDSSLVRMDDAYTSKELEAQKRNCDHLMSEIKRWRSDKLAFNTLYDTLSERTLVILAPKLMAK